MIRRNYLALGLENTFSRNQWSTGWIGQQEHNGSLFMVVLFLPLSEKVSKQERPPKTYATFRNVVYKVHKSTSYLPFFFKKKFQAYCYEAIDCTVQQIPRACW